MPARADGLWKPIRVVKAHYRLFLAITTGLVLGSLGPTEWRWPPGLLVGWDLGVALYLAHAVATVIGFDLKLARKRAAELDEGALAVLALSVAAAIASLVAIVAQLGAADAGGDGHGVFPIVH